MPNHTINNVDIAVNTGEGKELLALAELKNKLNISKDEFDFEGIIPMPKDLHKALEVERPFDDHDEWELDMGHLVPKDVNIRNQWLAKYGFDNWYEWRYENWDTKWNSYSVEIDANFDDELTVNFMTAWSAPLKIFEKVKEYCEENNLALRWEVSFEDDGYENFYDLMKGEVK